MRKKKNFFIFLFLMIFSLSFYKIANAYFTLDLSEDSSTTSNLELSEDSGTTTESTDITISEEENNANTETNDNVELMELNNDITNTNDTTNLLNNASLDENEETNQNPDESSGESLEIDYETLNNATSTNTNINISNSENIEEGSSSESSGNSNTSLMLPNTNNNEENSNNALNDEFNAMKEKQDNNDVSTLLLSNETGTYIFDTESLMSALTKKSKESLNKLKDEIEADIEKNTNDLDKNIAKKVQKKIETELKDTEKFEQVYNKNIQDKIIEGMEDLDLNKCKKYYSTDIKVKILKLYNLINLYSDRADKVMIAYSLWKQDTAVPAIVDTVMNIFYNDLKKEAKMAKYYLEALPMWNDLEFTHDFTCEEVKKSYKKILETDYKTALMHIYNEKEILEYRMKKIVEEFTDESPFDDLFTFYLSCTYEADYFDNLTPETWPKDENGKSLHKSDCQTTANPFVIWERDY